MCAIPTTRILLRSLGAYDETVRLKDSQYFLMQWLLLRKVRGATNERSHALSQIFLELLDRATSGVKTVIQGQ